MRALLVGFIGVALFGGAASAADCRAGHMSFTDGNRTFLVRKTSYSSRNVPNHASERVIFSGVLAQKAYLIDIQATQGSSSSVSSYAGSIAEPGLPPVWGARPKLWVNGDQLEILHGPLKGEWQAVCR